MTEEENYRGEISTIDMKVTSILTLLQGNTIDKDDKGLVGRINRNDLRISKLERMKDKVIWMAVGAGFAGGGIIGFVIQSIIKTVH